MQARANVNLAFRATGVTPLSLVLLLVAMPAQAHTLSTPSGWRVHLAEALGVPVAEGAALRGSVRHHVARALDAHRQSIESRPPAFVLDVRPEAGITGEVGLTRLSGEARMGLETLQLRPGLRREFGGAEWSVHAVLSYQRFASRGLGQRDWMLTGERAVLGAASAMTSSQATPVLGFEQWASGSALAVEWRAPLFGAATVDAAVQTRTNMEPFRTYRGVYADPGEFDLPANAKFGVSLPWVLGVEQSVRVGVDRRLYSDVEAFTSRALPQRFLSLLGDAGSPEFRWRDLTVYSFEWTARPDRQSAFTLRYSSRQQPEPTSELLRAALATEFTDRNFGLEYARDLGEGRSLRFGATYAPYPYFLGPSLFTVDAAGGRRQVEVEAVLRVPF